MQEHLLEKYIGQKIRYDIPPHFLWKEHAAGVGVLEYYKDQGLWQILFPDAGGFLLNGSMIEQIEFDREENMLTLVYMP